jgi:hypothetical protein
MTWGSPLLPPVTAGPDPITERRLRAIVGKTDWTEQQRLCAILPCKPARARRTVLGVAPGTEPMIGKTLAY